MASSRADLTISPFYHQAKNEIVQPGHFVACSRYFVQHWIPLLGGTAVSLILQLRSLGYYNPHTGELRDGVRVGIKKLAALCGCSDRTIQREIENNKWLGYFVRVESSYEQLPDGRIRHHENLYRIAMDDPLIPEHEPRLEALIEEREQAWKTQGEKRQGKGARRGSDHSAAGSRQPAAGRDEHQENPQSNPMRDILSPPPARRGRQSVTRVASKCRLKDSEDIPTQDIPSDIHNNNTPAPAANCQSSTAVVASSQESDTQHASLNTHHSTLNSDSLIVELAKRGVSRGVAKELVGSFDEDDIRLQMEALPLREAKDPAALLVKSIRESWALPQALFERRTRAEQRREEEEVSAARQADEARRWAERTEMRSRIEIYWQGLPAAEQARIDAEARETLRRTNAFVASLMERASAGPIVRATFDAARQDILRERLGLPQDL